MIRKMGWITLYRVKLVELVPSYLLWIDLAQTKTKTGQFLLKIYKQFLLVEKVLSLSGLNPLTASSNSLFSVSLQMEMHLKRWGRLEMKKGVRALSEQGTRRSGRGRGRLVKRKSVFLFFEELGKKWANGLRYQLHQLPQRGQIYWEAASSSKHDIQYSSVGMLWWLTRTEVPELTDLWTLNINSSYCWHPMTTVRYYWMTC